MLTGLLAVASAVMAVLHGAGRVAEPLPPAHGVGAPVGWVDDWWWICVHAAVIVLCLAAVVGGRVAAGIWAGCLSTVTWATWAVTAWMWAQDTVPPTSLVGPMLAAAVAAPLSAVTAWAWSDRD